MLSPNSAKQNRSSLILKATDLQKDKVEQVRICYPLDFK